MSAIPIWTKAAKRLLKRVLPVQRMLPRSLLGRSLLIIGAPLVLMQVIATWVFYAGGRPWPAKWR